MSVVMDKYDALEEEQNLRYFSFTFGVSQFFGALSVILVAVWMGSFDGGFGWQENPAREFHYHPLFMVIGLLFLYGEAILVYRLFRHEKKKVTKIAHVVLHSVVFMFFVLALKAVFDSHNLATPKSLKNMYSLHSWVGLSTVLLFCLQIRDRLLSNNVPLVKHNRPLYVCGFVSFFFPGLSLPVRQWYMPIHQFFGVAIFIFATAAALMGMAERAAWHVYNEKNCGADPFCSEGILVNFLGVSILLYSLSVVYLVVNPRFKRRPLPEEEMLQPLTTD